MKPYDFFDHTADIGVRVFGATREELFRNAAEALYEAMGKFAVKREDVKREIQIVEASGRAELLVAWLSDLLFRFDARREFYDKFEFVKLGDGELVAHVRGGTVDWERSTPSCELKAVTYHQASVEQLADGSWRATVIFDV